MKIRGSYNMKNEKKRVALFITGCASFLTPFMGSSVNIALPSIGKDFKMEAVLLNWVASSYLMAAAMFLVPFGKLADIYGRKKIFSYGILIYTISSFFSAISISSAMFISIRILQGIGSAMIFGTAMAILASIFPVSERGKALGINVFAVYLGLSLGPFLGGFLTKNFGWRSIFFVNAVIGLLVIILVFCKLKGEWKEQEVEKFDFIGSIMYIVALGVLMYSLSLLPDIVGIWLLVAGIFLFLVFILWEIKANSPILDINLFKSNIVFAFSNFAALINYSATFAIGLLLSLYLQYIKSLNAQQAGLVLTVQPIIMAIFSPFTGKLSDRIEPRIIASFGMILTTLSLFFFIFIGATTNLQFVIFNLVLLGLGLAFFSSPNTNAVMSSVEKKFYGVASATLGTMRLIGQMFSMGIVMFVFSLYIGKVRITPQYYSDFLFSMKIAFIIFTFLCFLGIFASFARGKIRGII